MSPTFDPSQFWNTRLAADLSLRGTGHRAFSLFYNQLLYTAQAEALTDLLTKHQIHVTGQRVLDVGSGAGFYVDFWTTHGAREVTGFDIALTSVQYLEAKYPCSQFRVVDIGEPNLPANSTYDLVSAISVLYHIVDDAHFEHGLINLANFTAAGGYLVVSDQFVPTRFVAKHARFRPLATYERILQALGLELLDLAPIYYLMNRVFIPKLGPLVLNRRVIASWLFDIDQQRRRAGQPNGTGMKFLLARRPSIMA